MSSKLQQMIQSVKEQEWAQQLIGSYQQLSADQQQYLKWGVISSLVVLGGYLTLNTMNSANSIKQEYFQKQELSLSLNQASDELRRLKGQSMGMAQATNSNWRTILQGFATAQGLQADSVELMKETNSSTQGVIQETLLEVQFKGLTVRPLVQLLYQIEHSQPPMKLKGMKIQPGASEGLMNARLNLSGYLAKGEKSK